MRSPQARRISVLARLHAPVHKHCADQRLADVRENGDLFPPARPRFAQAQHRISPDVPLLADLGAGFAPDELGKPHGKFAFGGVPESGVKSLGDRDPEHAVAEKFQPLIGSPAGNLSRQMSERKPRKLSVLERVTDPRFEFR